MLEEIVLRPIGQVRNEVKVIVDDVFGGTVSRIELDPGQFAAEALAGLSEFSHVEVVFYFDRIEETAIHHGARHPRSRTDWPKVGIFAQRAKNRPNKIGVTVCRLLRVEGRMIEVEDLDAIDGTPVLDVKPYLPEFSARGEVRQPRWAQELMSGYWNKAGT